MNKTHYIGLDVHKEKAAIAHAQEGSREEPVYHGKCAASVQNVERTLRKLAKKLGVEFRDLKVCYEAGPTVPPSRRDGASPHPPRRGVRGDRSNQDGAQTWREDQDRSRGRGTTR